MPSRGYAVGQAGRAAPLRQELDPGIRCRREVAGASFTSIAFAGSEAIVAYRFRTSRARRRRPLHGRPARQRRLGLARGREADAALAGAIPWAVAGLPDGGAAISAEDLGGRPLILEREAQGAPWQPTPAPYSGIEVPSSLALFREGGALRAVGTGNAPNTLQLDTNERPPPAGFPPNLIRPYPLASGYVLRQTASGWSDETHERNNAQDPPGEYKLYDMAYQPDPTAALLLDPNGTGWAVGGAIEHESPRRRCETGDVARYRDADAGPPDSRPRRWPRNRRRRRSRSGAARCVRRPAPTAPTRASARMCGCPRRSNAPARSPGVRAFLYTGPRVTDGPGPWRIPGPLRTRVRALCGRARLEQPAGLRGGRPERPRSGERVRLRAGLLGIPGTFRRRSGSPRHRRWRALQRGLLGRRPVRLLLAPHERRLRPPGARDHARRQLRRRRDPARVALVAARARPSRWPNRRSRVGSADLNAKIAAGDASAATLLRTLVTGPCAAAAPVAPRPTSMTRRKKTCRDAAARRAGARSPRSARARSAT